MWVTTDFKLGLAAGLVMTLLVGVLLGSFGAGQLRRFELARGRYQQAEEEVRRQDKRYADMQKAVALQLEARDVELAALRAERAALRAQVAFLQSRLPRLDAVVRSDSACWVKCAPALAARDSIIESQSAELAAADSQLARYGENEADLNRLLDEATETIAAKSEALRRAQGVIAVAKPGRSFWEILTKPRVGLGAFGGVCTTGQPCAGVGATLSWSP